MRERCFFQMTQQSQGPGYVRENTFIWNNSYSRLGYRSSALLRSLFSFASPSAERPSVAFLVYRPKRSGRLISSAALCRVGKERKKCARLKLASCLTWALSSLFMIKPVPETKFLDCFMRDVVVETLPKMAVLMWLGGAGGKRGAKQDGASEPLNILWATNSSDPIPCSLSFCLQLAAPSPPPFSPLPFFPSPLSSLSLFSHRPSQLWNSCPARPSDCQPARWTESHYAQS